MRKKAYVNKKILLLSKGKRDLKKKKFGKFLVVGTYFMLITSGATIINFF